MKTTYKAFAFAVLAAFVVALAAVPADDVSADTSATFSENATGDKFINQTYTGTSSQFSGQTVSYFNLTFTDAPTANFTIYVYDADKKLVTSEEVTADGTAKTFFSFYTKAVLTSGTTYYYVVSDGTNTYYTDLPDTPAADTYEVEVLTADNGSVAADKTSGVAAEATVTLTVTPDQGYQMNSLSVTTSSGNVEYKAGDTSGTYTFTMPAADVTVKAEFGLSGTTPVTYSITVKTVGAPEGAEVVIGGATDGKAAEEAAITLSVKGADGYTVAYTSDDVTITDNGFTMPGKDVTITATFTKDTPAADTYKVEVQTADNGSVAADKTSGVAAEATVTLTVTPDQGYQMNSLSVTTSSGNVEYKAGDTSGTYTFTMPAADVTVKAEFGLSGTTPVTYSITVKTVGAPEGAEVVIGGATDGKAAEEAAITLSVKGADGYTVAYTSDDVTITDNGFTMPGKDVTITATFTAETPVGPTDGYQVTYASGIHVKYTSDGRDVPSGTKVPAGTVLTVTADDRVGQVARISPSLTGTGDVKDQYTVTRDVSFKVTYSEKEYEEATLGGNVNTAGTVYSADQLVTITGDTTLMNGSSVTILGKISVPEGVTLTVAAGAKLVIEGVADIRGTVVIEAEDDSGRTTVPAGVIIAQNGGEISLSGRVTVGGLLGADDDSKLTVEAGSSIQIDDTGAVFGAIEIGDSASLTVSGAIGAEYDGEKYGASFIVSGTLVVSSEVLTEGFAVDLKESGSLTIEKASLLNGAEISVTDAGKTVYDSRNVDVVKKSSRNNTLVITGSASADKAASDEWSFGVEVDGISVTASTTTTKATASNASRLGVEAGQNVRSTTMSVSGTVSAAAIANYSGNGDEPSVTSYGVSVALNGANAARISSALVLGVNVDAGFAGTVAVAAPVTLNYLPGTSSAPDAQKATLAFESGSAITVTAGIDATAAPKAAAALTNSSKSLTLSGNGIIASLVDISTEGLNAAYYETTVRTASGNSTTYTYTTIDSAIATATDGSKITVFGKQSVTASATLPAKATLTLDAAAVLSIGAKATDTGVQLTIASGATVAGSASSTITVNGTLYAQKENDIRSVLRDGADQGKGIVSDVYAYETNAKGKVNGGWAKWTNLTTALAEATSGQTVEMNKDVQLASATVVPEGVTLDLNGHTLLVPNAVVLTVDGTLDVTETGSAVEVANSYEPKDRPTEALAAGSILLNGYVEYQGTVGEYYAPADKIVKTVRGDDGKYTATTELYEIAGAYYSLDSTDYITTVANAARIIATVDDQRVALVGTLDFQDVSFAGDARDGESATVNIAGKVTATGVSISNARIVFVASSQSSIEVSLGDAKVALKGEVASGTVVSAGAYGDTAAVLGFTGSVADYRTKVSGNDTAVSTSVSFSGTVYIIGNAAFSTDRVQIDGAVSIVKDQSASTAGTVSLGAETNDRNSRGAQYTATEITGTLTVKDGAVVSAHTVAVSGSLVVESQSFTAETMTVSGSIAAVATDSTTLRYTGSIAVTGELYLGTDRNIKSEDNVSKASFTATASAAGNVSAAYAVVAAGATVPAGWTGTDSALSTAFAVQSTAYSNPTTGADGYVTVYQPSASATAEVSDIYYPTTDSLFKGWVNASGTNANSVHTDIVGASGWTSVTPKIDYQIYAIQITSDGGVAYITVDGVLMEQTTNVFKITGLKAGEHTVAASAASGYDISKIVLTATDGSSVGSMTVRVSGMDEDALKDDGFYWSEYQLVGSTTSSTGGSTGGMSSEDAKGIIDAINKNTDAVKDQDKNITVKSDSDSDNGLTNILLVVLVILILVMAVLVAMRMMRS